MHYRDGVMMEQSDGEQLWSNGGVKRLWRVCRRKTYCLQVQGTFGVCWDALCVTVGKV